MHTRKRGSHVNIYCTLVWGTQTESKNWHHSVSIVQVHLDGTFWDVFFRQFFNPMYLKKICIHINVTFAADDYQPLVAGNSMLFLFYFFLLSASGFGAQQASQRRLTNFNPLNAIKTCGIFFATAGRKEEQSHMSTCQNQMKKEHPTHGWFCSYRWNLIRILG